MYLSPVNSAQICHLRVQEINDTIDIELVGKHDMYMHCVPVRYGFIPARVSKSSYEPLDEC